MYRGERVGSPKKLDDAQIWDVSGVYLRGHNVILLFLGGLMNRNVLGI